MTQEAILPNYYIRVTNAAGSAFFDQFSGCSFTKMQNGIGSYQFTVDGSDSRLQYFTLDALVEIYRAVPGVGLAFYREFVGLHQTPLKKTDASGKRTFTSSGVHLNDLLSRRLVAWEKGRAESKKYGTASTVLKEYVLENCGVSALASLGRVRDGMMPGFDVDSGNFATQGGDWSGDRSMENLFDVAREIAAFGNFQFDVTNDAQHQFFFQTADSFGLDCTFGGINPQSGRNGAGNIPVVFSVAKGTVQEMEFEEDRAGEKNAVFATGTVDTLDQTVFVESEHALDSPWNDREAVTSGGSREDTTTAELIAQAQETLALNQIKQIFRFKPRQTATALYGRDYQLAYRVTSQYDSDSADQTIMTVKVTVNDDRSESIEMELVD